MEFRVRNMIVWIWKEQKGCFVLHRKVFTLYTITSQLCVIYAFTLCLILPFFSLIWNPHRDYFYFVCLHLVWLLVLQLYGSNYDRQAVKGYLATFYSPGQRNRKTKEKGKPQKTFHAKGRVNPVKCGWDNSEWNYVNIGKVLASWRLTGSGEVISESWRWLQAIKPKEIDNTRPTEPDTIKGLFNVESIRAGSGVTKQRGG